MTQLAEEQGLRRMPDGRLMQCKDIPDAAFLAAVKQTAPVGGWDGPGRWRMTWEVRATLEADAGPIPYKLFIAKGRRLIERGLLVGCGCGCRGDYHLPDECFHFCGCTEVRAR